jgi:hypothetical protein
VWLAKTGTVSAFRHHGELFNAFFGQSAHCGDYKQCVTVRVCDEAVQIKH